MRRGHHYESLTQTTPDRTELSGKCVFVTGGTKGAGKAIAERFKQGGATVIITARSVPEESNESHFIQADVSTPAGTTKVITEILHRFGGVDIIVHNVGGSSSPGGGFATVTLQEGRDIRCNMEHGAPHVCVPARQWRSGHRDGQGAAWALDCYCDNALCPHEYGQQTRCRAKSGAAL